MTRQRAPESRACVAVSDLGHPRVREGINEFGFCVCGTHMSWHVDTDDRHLSCDHPDVVWARIAFGHGSSPDQFSEDDARTALLIFAAADRG